jgi:hypothetical protein
MLLVALLLALALTAPPTAPATSSPSAPNPPAAAPAASPTAPPPSSPPSSNTASAPAWQSVDLGRSGDFIIRVRVLTPASLLYEEWLSLEFENTGREPVRVTNAYYRIERTTLDPQSGRAVSFGSLASGNTHDLFPDAWKTTPVAPILLQPGVCRVVQQPSDYSAALLGLAPPAGWTVEARLHLTLELAGQRLFSTPPEGVSFTFTWRAVAASELDALRARLHRLLRAPTHAGAHVYILQALLRIPSVGDTLSTADLLAALTGRSGNMDGRDTLRGEIARRFPRDPAVLDYYATRLRAGPTPWRPGQPPQRSEYDLALEDLAREPRIWDPNWVASLLDQFERLSVGTTLSVLASHRADWPIGLAVAARLSTGVIAGAHTLTRHPEDLTCHELTITWVNEARQLALTRDPAAAPLLRPYLKCRERILDLSRCAIAAGYLDYPGPALRVCDVALDAILTLRGEDLTAAYAEVRPPPAAADPFPRDLGAYESAMDGVRDRLIADLLRRLD